MIYHFVINGVYVSRFRNFLLDNSDSFDMSRHIFIYTNNDISNQPSLQISSLHFKNLFNYIKFGFRLKKTDRVVLHSYSHPYLYLLCFLFSHRIRHFSWIIWGGDLYFYKESNKFKYKIYEFIRRLTIRRFGYIGSNKGDYILAKKYYNAKAKHIHVFYPQEINQLTFSISSHSLNILVGNSGTSSNNHIEALQLLEKFKDENLIIYVPLSYGATPEYTQKINKFGFDVFGSKYIPLVTFLPILEYHKLLSTIDIMVCNHNRQQALGNIITLMANGAKIYIRKNISTNSFFQDLDLHYDFTENISNYSINEFKLFHESKKQENKIRLNKHFSNSSLVKQWTFFFKTLYD